MNSDHGVLFSECLTRFCDEWKVKPPKFHNYRFLRSWSTRFLTYIYDMPQKSGEYEKRVFLTDFQMSLLLNFFILHGSCLRKHQVSDD